jgi:hypothetical protein
LCGHDWFSSRAAFTVVLIDNASLGSIHSRAVNRRLKGYDLVPAGGSVTTFALMPE